MSLTILLQLILAVCGINPDPEDPGFHHIILRPCFPKGLDIFSCSYDSPRGRIDISWQRKKRNVILSAIIPCGSSATLHLPDGHIYELASGIHSIII